MIKINAAGIILAAGRGSRMRELTAEKPKCLLELAGKPLLHWQLEAMRSSGIEKILVVRGYAGHCLHGNFAVIDNPRWHKTNMLSSLLCAKNFINAFFADEGKKILVSYSDIVWRKSAAEKLLQNHLHIAITYDVLWEKLWRLRFADPLSDAETFVQKDGFLLEIGNKTTDISQIQGQYMGLFAFDETGWQSILSAAHELAENVDRTDMTSFLRHLLHKQIPIAAVAIKGGWCETDNANDLKTYEDALASGSWCHDWRGKNDEAR